MTLQPTRLITFLALTLSFLVAHGATRLVTSSSDLSSDVNSLRFMVTNASAGDTILIDPSVASITYESTNGPIVVNTDVIIIGHGAENISISAFSAQHFIVNDGVRLYLRDLTLQNGYSVNEGASIRVLGSSLLDCSGVRFFQGFTDGNGGAIEMASANSTLVLNKCEFEANECDGSGGAIVAQAGVTVNVDSCYFYQNTTYSGNGGAIDMVGGTQASSLVVRASEFELNQSAGDGGAISIGNEVSLTMNTSLVHSSTTNSQGGGIVVSTSQEIHISNSTFYNNRATNGSGGGIYLDESSAASTLTNCTFVQNQASGALGVGGGLVTQNAGAITLQNNVFHQNSASGGSGGLNIYADPGTSMLSNGSNFISVLDNGGVFTADASDVTGIGNLPQNPMLDVFGDYGGITRGFAPQCSSPLINGGDNTGVSGTDQRGESRISDTRVDIGAIEQQGAVQDNVVTTTAPAGCGSLRHWIINASSAQQDTITVDPSLGGETIQLFGSNINVPVSVVVIGDSVNPLTLDAEEASNHFESNSGHFQLSHFRLINGRAPFGTGGSILISQGASGTFRNLEFANNQAIAQTGAGFGGAVAGTTADALNIYDCYFHDNFATNSGGAIYGSTGGLPGTLNVEGCVFENNAANQTSGGAIIAPTTPLVLRNCTFTENYSVDGGAVYLGSDGGDDIQQCTFFNNTADNSGGAIGITGFFSSKFPYFSFLTIIGNGADFGGGINNAGAFVSMENSIVAQNTADDFFGSNDIQQEINGSMFVTNCLIGDANTIPVASIQNSLTGNTATPLDPELQPIGNYGGTTETMPPMESSPVIDRGLGSSFELDQRDSLRISGVAIDMGAVEYQYPCDTFSVQYSFNNGACGTFEFALDQANQLSGTQVITFENLDSNIILTGDGSRIITDKVIIDGTTAPGFVDDPVLVFEGLDGGDESEGLSLNSGATGTEIRGVIFKEYAAYTNDFVINVEGADSITLENNHFGYDENGVPQPSAYFTCVRLVNSDHSLIGGILGTDGNKFAKFQNALLIDSCDNITVQGNFFGTSVDGETADTSYLVGQGVALQVSSTALVGGESNQANIFGTVDGGVFATQSSDGVYKGNRFGISATDQVYPQDYRLGQGAVSLTGASRSAVHENYFYNQYVGVWNRGSDSIDVWNNRFGVQPDGTVDTAHASFVPIAQMEGNYNTYGPNNLIAGNDTMAIYMVNDSAHLNGHNRVTRNSIYCNNGQAIVLEDSANYMHPAPDVLAVTESEISGKGIPGDSVEVFLTGTICPDTVGQGETYLGTVVVAADSTWGLTGAFDPYQSYSATQDSLGNTSEYGLYIAPCDTFHVVSNADDNTCGTLRFAIDQANALDGVDTITFDLRFSGYLIELGSSLSVTEQLVIDGTTDPNYGMLPVVRLSPDPLSIGSINGIVCSTAATEIRGLSFNGFIHGIQFDNFSGNLVEDCYFGLDSSGASLGAGNASGIALNSHSDAIIRNNVICNSTFYGVFGYEAAHAQVTSNILGTLPNDTTFNAANGFGVWLEERCDSVMITDNDIRFSTDAGVCIINSEAGTIGNNVVTDGDSVGLYNFASQLLVTNNQILRNSSDGILQNGGVQDTIGVLGQPNLIQDNGGAGLHIEGSDSLIVIQGNDFVTNGSHGILVADGANKIQMRFNSFDCNEGKGIHLELPANENIPAPNITVVSDSLIEGKAAPGAILDLFYADTCQQDQGLTWVDSVVVLSDSSWTLTGAYEGNIHVVAMVTAENERSSEFSSSAFIIGCEDTPVATDFDTTIFYQETAVFNVPLDTFPWTVAIIQQPLQGAAVFLDTATIEYTSTIPFDGNDTIKYVVENECGQQDTGLVVIGLSCPDVPVASSIDTTLVPKNLAVFDLALDTSLFQVSILQSANLGAVTVENGDELHYDPTLGVSGQDSLMYEVTNVCGADSAAWVFIELTCGSDTNARFIDTAGAALQEILLPVNPDTSVFSVVMIQQPTIGIAQIQTNGEIRYISSVQSLDRDTLVYELTSICGQVDTAVVTIDLSCEDTPEPVPFSASFETFAIQEWVIEKVSTQVLSIASSPMFGTAWASGDTLYYQSNSRFEGADSFIYSLEDECGRVRSAEVSLTVDAIEIPVNTTKGVSNIIRIEVPENVDTSTFNLIQAPAGQILSLNIANGFLVIEYSPEETISSDTLYYQLCSEDGSCIEREVVNTVGDPLASTGDITATVIEAISPNGDGVNDFMEILLCDEFDCQTAVQGYSIHLTVFDPWGNQVYESENYENDPGTGFYGQSRGIIGETVSEGVYYWVVELWNDNERLKIDRQNGYLVVKID